MITNRSVPGELNHRCANIGQEPVTAKAPAKEEPKVEEPKALLRDGKKQTKGLAFKAHYSGYPYLAIGCLVSFPGWPFLDEDTK